MIQGISEELQREIRSCVNTYIDRSMFDAFFFGSRVIGTARETSDIDVGVIGTVPLTLAELVEIKDALEHIHTLYTIDFVDCTDASDDFKKVALAHIIPIEK